MSGKKRKVWYIQLLQYAIIAAVIVIVYRAMFCSTLHKGFEYFNSKTDNTTRFFDEEILGKYQDINFTMYHKNVFFKDIDTTAVVATYESSYFTKQLLRIMRKYKFTSPEHNEKRMSFAMGKWYLTVVRGEVGDKRSIFPADYCIIGFDEADNKVAYLTFKSNVRFDANTALNKEYMEKYFGYLE